ncbi:hypothetical protein HRR83_005512 [Exophiala dermatitidis]|uniref:Chromosome condensation protein n=1 Tax=Exophiala dermatitidis TaxID=5970 RepID=A0AAN6EU89_EXODE|nr:hypothetical protein HRR75_004918 [Exophiala dermatitidis]KAJ4516207.1 hypothetical protein HRR74_005364 [Exophiala dermatitidis]KAJ4518387.1 hypothetical protein HRR73_003968 [Exophiala dermatitidis]KAJ4533878.1 hypothetical protein HRR76_005831 [Exophiala dermatitidis]KAJ4550034.1 hypothetical protein HRR77_003517 [Exophiala dermatitidis]
MSPLREHEATSDLEKGAMGHRIQSSCCDDVPTCTDELYDENAELSELAMPPPVESESTHHKSISLENEEHQARITRTQLQESQNRTNSERTSIPAYATVPSQRRCSRSPQSQSSHSRSSISDVQHVTEGADGSQEKEMPLQQRMFFLPSTTEIFIVAHLIFFSILGTLARLGLEAITQYPRAPVLTAVLWANVAGSFIFGFLVEDRRLFREEWGKYTEEWSFKHLQDNPHDTHLAAEAIKRHRKAKATIPLYIGLATGFCGSFTSFSTFMRDAFLALSDELVEPKLPQGHSRHRGYDFEAVAAVLIIHVAGSIGALKVGAHAALATEKIMPILPFRWIRTVLDPLMVFLGPCCWLAAVFLATWPPRDDWRGRVLFSLIFAPVGCLFRFYVSRHLNGRFWVFPAGTFTANIFGTAILGMSYDLQHSGTRGLLSCQILEGIIEGYCGCATTVSTWVGELQTLERIHAYLYGTLTLVAGLGLLVLIIGSLLWTEGLQTVICQT